MDEELLEVMGAVAGLLPDDGAYEVVRLDREFWAARAAQREADRIEVEAIARASGMGDGP
ncbi:hypothetical protein SRB5_56370 [Streptomyces sp. RB5]|uniref:Uncharacterized protein n=1 Tax=Streptomyces smaragdinus TaxID=2585196 RepID=A0A7K0CPP6_9ACTN|nr:hypothetical protein [Streptomyces smaragdinus]MQY15455.1 hypothetical protein [Streptomyces smaragdinus]